MGIDLRAVLLASSLLVTVRATGCSSFLSPISCGLIIPLLPTICQLSGSKSHDCADRCKTVHPLRILLFINGLHRHWWIYREQVKSVSAPLIRARSVVQVHPGPPFKSPVNTRRFSLFPFWGLPLKKPFCQPFVNFTIDQMALHSGRKDPSVKAERLASIRLCRERCPVTSKDVEGSARHCKTVQGAGSHFLVSLRGRSSVG